MILVNSQRDQVCLLGSYGIRDSSQVKENVPQQRIQTHIFNNNTLISVFSFLNHYLIVRNMIYFFTFFRQ